MLKKIFGIVTILGVSLGVSINSTSAASAPPLTTLEVKEVQSELGGTESITASQTTTTKDHGGSFMYITTFQKGYSSSKTATFDGTILTLIASTPVDVDGDTIVDGFLYKWNASGKQSGLFKYQATSQNSPWNTMSDTLNIQ